MAVTNPEAMCQAFDGLTLDQAVATLREGLVRLALKRSNNHHQKAARSLGIHRNTLTRIMASAGMPLSTRQGGRPGNSGTREWQALGKERRDGQDNRSHV